MWTLLLLLIASAPNIVSPQVSADRQKLILQGGDDPCHGHIQLFHEGKWGLVGSDQWTLVNEHVACRSIGCGTSLRSSDLPLHAKDMPLVWKNELTCFGDEEQLWKCPGPGWNVSIYTNHMVKKIRCSERVQLGLDGSRCAGAVYYNKTSDKSPVFFCGDWDQGGHWGDLVCEERNCGKQKPRIDANHITTSMLWSSPELVTTSCATPRQETHPWQCASGVPGCNKPAAVICSGHVVWRLQGGSNVCEGRAEQGEGEPVSCPDNATAALMCKEMRCGNVNSSQCEENKMWLKCSDNITVFLKNEATNEVSKCFGVVYVAGPLGQLPVCATSWIPENARVVCRELGCGEAVGESFVHRKTEAILDYVKCTGDEESLWHCLAKYNAKPLQCSYVVSVTCGACVNVKLSDGPGRCAGRLELKFAGQWHRVESNKWTPANTHVACREMGCGKAELNVTLDQLSQGDLPFLNNIVKCEGSQNLSDCGMEKYMPTPTLPTTIVCEDHLEVFVKGSRWCEGKVGVRHHHNLYWLSGAAATWTQTAANVVCQQMHCGNAKEYYNASTSAGENVWPKEYNCSKEKSLFDCPVSNNTDNSTTAFVTCTDDITLGLIGDCWGAVKVCINKRCGGVCRDSWSDIKAEAVCQHLAHCGKFVRLPMQRLPEPLLPEHSLKVKVTSMHFDTLSGNSLVMNTGGSTYCKDKPAVVVCSGSLRAMLAVSRDHCFGNVQVFSQGRWRPVCKTALDESVEAQEAICAALNCGQSAESLDFFGPSPGAVTSVTKLSCPAGNKSLASCGNTLSNSSCSHGGLKCSGWKRLVLVSKAGGGACEGVVFVYYKGGPAVVSSHGWTRAEGHRLCQDLGCGGYQNHSEEELDGATAWGTFNCSGVDKLQNIWDCMRSENATADKPSNRLYLTCQGNLQVSLSKDCRGEVLLNNQHVCNRHWTLDNSHRVCQEMGCSNAIKEVMSSGNATGVEVSCLGSEERLGQCMTSKGSCKAPLVSVFCTNAIRFKTTEQCGGRIQVRHQEERWEMICPPLILNDLLKDNLCAFLNCTKATNHIPERSQEFLVDLKLSLVCTNNHMDIRHCVRKIPCEKSQPAEIYCHGYVPQSLPNPPDLWLLVFLVLGVLLLSLACGLFFLLRRLVFRNTKLGRFPRRDVEVDSGEYEDVGSTVNEKSSLSRMDSRSPPAVVLESDSASASQSYDDIAEEDPGETWPLTKEEAPGGAPEDNSISSCSDAPTPKAAASVIYGPVNQQQEDYDDVVAADRQVSETTAEVHRELPPVPTDDAEGADY